MATSKSSALNKSASAHPPGDFVGPVEARLEQFYEGPGMALQALNPQVFALPFVRSSKGLAPTDFMMKPKSDKPRHNISGINLSLPQAQQPALPALFNSYKTVESLLGGTPEQPGHVLTLTGADLAFKAENSAITNAILRTPLAVERFEIFLGHKRLSTIFWPLMSKDKTSDAGAATEPLMNVGLLGPLSSVMLSPAHLKLEIRVYFAAGSAPADATTSPDGIIKHTLFMIHQIMPFRSIPARAAFLLSDGDATMKRSFEEAEVEIEKRKDDEGNFVNSLPRGLGFKCTTHERIELVHSDRVSKWTVPAKQDGRVFSVIWVRVPKELVSSVEDLNMLGSSVHGTLAGSHSERDRDSAAKHVNLYFHFTGGGVTLSDAGANAIMQAQKGDEFVVNFSRALEADEASAIEAFVVWYDLYALRDNQAKLMTPGAPAWGLAGK
jgi:hypothetical protein